MKNQRLECAAGEGFSLEKKIPGVQDAVSWNIFGVQLGRDSGTGGGVARPEIDAQLPGRSSFQRSKLKNTRKKTTE